MYLCRSASDYPKMWSKLSELGVYAIVSGTRVAYSYGTGRMMPNGMDANEMRSYVSSHTTTPHTSHHVHIRDLYPWFVQVHCVRHTRIHHAMLSLRMLSFQCVTVFLIGYAIHTDELCLYADAPPVLQLDLV